MDSGQSTGPEESDFGLLLYDLYSSFLFNLSLLLDVFRVVLDQVWIMHRLNKVLGNPRFLNILGRRTPRFFSSDNLARESIFTDEHVELRRSLNKIIEKEINPYVDEWEAACRFPAHDVFKKLGNAGFLGVTKPIECGGMGLDFTFGVAVAEELGSIKCLKVYLHFMISPYYVPDKGAMDCILQHLASESLIRMVPRVTVYTPDCQGSVEEKMYCVNMPLEY